MAPPDPQGFAALVRAALSEIIGDSGANAILFYVGEPDPKTFESKLAAIVGEGAAKLVIQDIQKRSGEAPSPHKQRWFGGHSTGTRLPRFSRPSGSGLLPLLW
ncbi:MAG: hypothetical protein OK442_09190 [Thaumarchaeota archaeon]|nr:hypothetical protein [Nitrososphaerota archaeon]